MLIGFVIGGVLGLVAGYFRGRIDTVIVGDCSTSSSPSRARPRPLARHRPPATAVTAGRATAGLDPEVALILALGIVSIPVLGRITRASTLAWSEREFVLAARAQGAKNGRIICREILPNVLPAMLSIALLGVAVVIVAEGGARHPRRRRASADTPTWGNMIASRRAELISGAPHIVFEPALVIFLTVLALNFLGDVVRGRFDVRESAL